MESTEVFRRIQECVSNKLPVLDLSNTGLARVPDEVFELTHLIALNLGSESTPSEFANTIKEIPNTIRHLQKLERLYIDNNNLDHLPSTLVELTHLQRLHLANNKFTQVPEVITLLPALQELSLIGNQLFELPQNFNRLQQLKSLHLDNNRLNRLPPTVTHLQSLVTLSINANQIHTLPETISQLINLRYLYAENNLIRALPATLARLENLVELSINLNPLDSPPPEIVAGGLAAVRAFLDELDSQPESPVFLYEAKLLLVGEGRVGKTSLAKALSIPTYILEDEQTTKGIDIRPWTIPNRDLNFGADFRLNIWDFGGQEIYHATHQFFLTKRSIYLLVTESRRDDKHEDFYYWLNIVRLLGDQSPVIIVLNKSDQPTIELPINEYQKSFENIAGYLKTSCLPDRRSTIINLQEAIFNILKSDKLMPHIGTALPRVWLTIREQIEELRISGRDHISYEEYLTLCQQVGMNETRALFLSDFFHDLGMFLHFRDEVTLFSTLFLNHTWITNAVYRVLDAESVIANYGRFDELDLIKIWHEHKYSGHRPALLALMKNRKFEICYELSDGGYLAPQLLPVDEHPRIDEWSSDPTNLQFEYRYRFMPKGLLSRFIVKRHEYIWRDVSWRYGVILEYENTRALVRERYFERKITVELNGRDKKGFLEVIRSTFHDIHRNFKNLELTEMIPCNCGACSQNSERHFYKYDVLQRHLGKGMGKVICDLSSDEVDIISLVQNLMPDIVLDRQPIIRQSPNLNLNIRSEGGAVIVGNVTTGGSFTGRDVASP